MTAVGEGRPLPPPPAGGGCANRGRVPLTRQDELARLHSTHADMAGDIRSTHAVRLGLRQIKGFSRGRRRKPIVAARGRGYNSVRDLWLRSGLGRAAIERLADGDAFRSIGLDRRDALWAARELGGGKASDRLPLFDTPELADIRNEPDVALPPMPIGEHVVNDYRFLSLSLKAHPLSFLRERLAAQGIIASEALRGLDAEDRRPHGQHYAGRVTVAGLVLVRQRPGTASGVIFMTIEDETDIANIVVWPKMFERFRPVVLGARLVAVTGKVQSESGVIHVIADRLEDLTPMLGRLSRGWRRGRGARPRRRGPPPGVDKREKIGPLAPPAPPRPGRARRRRGSCRPRRARRASCRRAATSTERAISTL